ncbi:MAG: hypothetical protein ACOCVF_03920 [bacterium]
MGLLDHINFDDLDSIRDEDLHSDKCSKMMKIIDNVSSREEALKVEKLYKETKWTNHEKCWLKSYLYGMLRTKYLNPVLENEFKMTTEQKNNFTSEHLN